MSRGQPTEDTKLIAQLMQQLQVQQLNIGMLEAERGNSMAVAAAAAPPPPQQQQQHPSPRGPTHVRSGSPRAAHEQPQPQPRRQGEKPPKARSGPASPRVDRRPPQQGSHDYAEPDDQQFDQQQQQQQTPSKARPKARAPRKPKAMANPPPEAEDSASGAQDAERVIPWDEFAGDDEGAVVQPADAQEAEEMERRRLARTESRFDSISEEIKALNSGLISEPSTVAPVDTRQPCPNCGRKFLPDRLGRHVKVCEDLKRGKEWRGTWKSPHASASNLHGGPRDAWLSSSFKA